MPVKNKPDAAQAGAQYESHKARVRERHASVSRAGRDIGAVPAVVDAARKERGRRDFRFFAETYLPETFRLRFSDDHLKAIARIEQSVLSGGLFAYAMPRGSGKTSLAEAACLWATLYGHRQFVVLIGSDEGHAELMLDSIKSELENNGLLAEDFPAATYPISKLEGIANRCSGQLCGGARTHVEWTAKMVVLPTIAGGESSGAVITTRGLTGRLRGLKHKRPDGKTVRPDLVVPDDPQTDESARSPSQCATREAILAGAVLGMAGPGVKISGIMPCTVVCHGDMADRILDRAKHPEWHGERTKLLYALPTDAKLWERYAELRAESLRAGGDGEEATEFYRKNRKAMDAGARPAWPERFNPDELSAIQHAMNLKLRDEASFAAEYQNEPHKPAAESDADLTAEQIAGKINRMGRGEVPASATRLTAFVDVQGALLYWAVVAWADDFTGWLIDYGAYPDQGRAYFTLRDAKRTLASLVKGGGQEAAIHAGLEAVADLLCGRAWMRDDGAELRVERLLIDANWGDSTETVYQFCRQSRFAGVIGPAHGRGIGASSLSITAAPKKPGEKVGLNWRLSAGARKVRHLAFDANFWKSFVAARLATPMGGRGCLSIFGDKSDLHRLLSEHLTAEYRVRTEGRGRTVDEWKIRPNRPDNHYLDCLAGAAVAASLQGAVLLSGGSGAAPQEVKKKRVSFAELQRKAREAKGR